MYRETKSTIPLTLSQLIERLHALGITNVEQLGYMAHALLDLAKAFSYKKAFQVVAAHDDGFGSSAYKSIDIYMELPQELSAAKKIYLYHHNREGERLGWLKKHDGLPSRSMRRDHFTSFKGGIGERDYESRHLVRLTVFLLADPN